MYLLFTNQIEKNLLQMSENPQTLVLIKIKHVGELQLRVKYIIVLAKRRQLWNIYTAPAYSVLIV